MLKVSHLYLAFSLDENQDEIEHYHSIYQNFHCLLEIYQGFQRPIVKTLMKLFEYV